MFQTGDFLGIQRSSLAKSLKTSLRQNALAAGLVTSTQEAFGGFISNHQLVKLLEAFAPNSSGSPKARADLTILSAQQTFPLICQLLVQLSQSPVETKSVDSTYPPDASKGAAVDLAALFNKYGSDKASSHNYHLFYAAILQPIRLNRLRVLEIGLGTNNPDVVSTMGRSGRPGASLRALRDFLPNSEIFGADIDRRILFEEERIKTYYADQTNLQSLEELAAALPGDGFDLIVDDGLHSPSANIATFMLALRKLRSGGWFVVEDIAEKSVPIWQVISSILPREYAVAILRGRSGFMFVVQKHDR